jgi:hypothetical protein
MVFTDSATLNADFEAGYPFKGYYRWPNGDSYIEELDHYKLHGHGQFIHSDGALYKGNFV